MTKLIINLGDENAGNGDPLRVAFGKINENFTELYTTGGGGSLIPEQSNNDGKFLTTDGTSLVWETITGAPANTGNYSFSADEIRNAASNVKLVANSDSVSKRVLTLYTDGSLELPTSNLGAGKIQSAQGVWIHHSASTWKFDADNGLTFPDNTRQTTAWLGTFNYADLTNKPVLFSGSYNDLTNKPTIPSLTGYATESYVGTAIADLVASAPSTLNTLNELAAALGDDANFATTITTALGNKANTTDLADFITLADLPASLTDRLTAGNYSVVMNNKGTLTVPNLLPKTFTATVDDAHFVGPLVLTGDAWHFDVTFAVSANGVVQTYIDNQTPWPSNPGYTNGMEFIYTEADHGIPDYTFTLELTDIQNPGPMMYTTNLAASIPPAYPSTISSTRAIKISAGASNLIYGVNGVLNVGSLQTTGLQTNFTNSNAFGISIDGYNEPNTIDIGDIGSTDFARLLFGTGAVTGNPGDVEIQSPPIGTPGVPSTISISPQGGQSGSFKFGGNGVLTFTDGVSSITAIDPAQSGGISGLSIAGKQRAFIGINSDTYSYSWDFRSYGSHDYSTTAKPAIQFPGGGWLQEDITDIANQNIPVQLGSQGSLTLTTLLNDLMNPVENNWVFGRDGILTLPAGGDIVDSTGTSVLGGGGGSTSVTTDTTPPTSPSLGDLWYDVTGGRMYVYYDDSWIDSNPVATQDTVSQLVNSGHVLDLGATGEVIFPSVSLGTGKSEQVVIKGQRKTIPPLHYSAVISTISPTPTVVYTASSVDISSMKLTMQVQHLGYGFEMFEVVATKTGIDTYYSISHRVKPPSIVDTTVVVDVDVSGVMQVILTINSNATNAWVTYDATEFGIAVD